MLYFLDHGLIAEHKDKMKAVIDEAPESVLEKEKNFKKNKLFNMLENYDLASFGLDDFLNIVLVQTVLTNHEAINLGLSANPTNMAGGFMFSDVERFFSTSFYNKSWAKFKKALFMAQYDELENNYSKLVSYRDILRSSVNAWHESV